MPSTHSTLTPFRHASIPGPVRDSPSGEPCGPRVPSGERDVLCSSTLALSATKALKFPPNLLISQESSRKKHFFQRGCLHKGKQSLVTLHNRPRQGRLFRAPAHLLTRLPADGGPCLSSPQPRGSWGCGLWGAEPEKHPLTGAACRCTVPRRWQFFHLLLSSGCPPRWLSKASPSIQGQSGRLLPSPRQLSLPGCSTEMHIIFLCHDRKVSLIYHPLPARDCRYSVTPF